MPRRPRIILPNVPLHIIQRGNNRQACFYADRDYRLYLEWLKDYAEETGCNVHAYVLMTNHIHLLVTPVDKESVGSLMKRLGQRYTQYINRTYQRTGTLWGGRFRSSIVQEERYFFICQRYIELNPVRAEIVQFPGDYRWSSYCVNALGEDSDLVKTHPLYDDLGRTGVERREAYRELFQHELEPTQISAIRSAVNGNFVFGSEQYQQQIAGLLGCKVTPCRRGRPPQKMGSDPFFVKKGV